MSENAPLQKSTPKEFFLYLLTFFTLYVTTCNLVSLLFHYVNVFFPQPDLMFYWTDLMRWHIASLIVMFPVYLYVSGKLQKEARLQPEKRDLRVRKWLINFTLFVAALIIMYRFIWLIFSLLSGDILMAFLIKTVILFLIIGAIFYFYLQDLKRPWSSADTKLFSIVAGLLILTAVIYGVYLTNPKITLTKANIVAIPYCKAKSLPVTPEEDKAIQPLVNAYARQAECDIGTNCLEKWNDKGTVKFSIAWQSPCGSQNGIISMSQSNHGTTFVCRNYPNKNVCCWPLGDPSQTVCSNQNSAK